MSDFKNLVQKLFEAQDYINMFNDFINTNDQSRQTIEKYIKWARANLKKNDRIVWFLRWVRIELAGRLHHQDSNTELAKLNKRWKTAITKNDLIPLNNLMTNLTHFLGLPIPEIQKIVWLKQSPVELIEEFTELENEWKDTAGDDSDAEEMYQKGRLHDPHDPYYPDEMPKIVMEFPDGYTWFDLEKSYCDQESRAMGHCGNAGGSGTILSLRKPVRYRGEIYWYPVLTFILHDGVLGEMKGRNNDKPAERYHPYIVALLKSDLITGIRGGGYLPSHNFSLNDLDPEEKEELLRLKPELGGLDYLYDKEGMTQRVLDLLGDKLRENLNESYVSYDKENENFVVETFGSFESFLRHIDDDEVLEILEIATGEADFQTSKDNQELFSDLIINLPEEYQQQAIERSGMANASLHDVAMQLIRINDEWYNVFQDVISNKDIIKEEAWERLAMYADAGWTFSASYVWDNIPTDVDVLKKFVEDNTDVSLTVSERDMIGYVSANEDDDDEYGHDFYKIREDGWAGIEQEYLSERRREEGLWKNRDWREPNGKIQDKWLAGVDTSGIEENLVSNFVNSLNGVRSSKTINDPRQMDLNFESLTRLKKLSGLI